MTPKASTEFAVGELVKFGARKAWILFDDGTPAGALTLADSGGYARIEKIETFPRQRRGERAVARLIARTLDDVVVYIWNRPKKVGETGARK